MTRLTGKQESALAFQRQTIAQATAMVVETLIDDGLKPEDASQIVVDMLMSAAWGVHATQAITEGSGDPDPQAFADIAHASALQMGESHLGDTDALREILGAEG